MMMDRMRNSEQSAIRVCLDASSLTGDSFSLRSLDLEVKEWSVNSFIKKGLFSSANTAVLGMRTSEACEANMAAVRPK
jgi:hypothetical protein